MKKQRKHIFSLIEKDKDTSINANIATALLCFTLLVTILPSSYKNIRSLMNGTQIHSE